MWWWERIVFLCDPILFYLSWQLPAQHSPLRVEPRLSPLRPDIKTRNKKWKKGKENPPSTWERALEITVLSLSKGLSQKSCVLLDYYWWKELIEFLQLLYTHSSKAASVKYVQYRISELSNTLLLLLLFLLLFSVGYLVSRQPTQGGQLSYMNNYKNSYINCFIHERRSFILTRHRCVAKPGLYSSVLPFLPQFLAADVQMRCSDCLSSEQRANATCGPTFMLFPARDPVIEGKGVFIQPDWRLLHVFFFFIFHHCHTKHNWLHKNDSHDSPCDPC